MSGMKRSGPMENNPNAFSHSHNPTPLEFNRFIPWILLREEVGVNIEINNINIYEITSKTSSASVFSRKFFSSVPRVNTETCTKTSADSIEANFGCFMNFDKKVTITAFHCKGQMTELAFINCQQPVPRAVLDAVQLCLPYHPALTRITWKGDYLTGSLINAISKMLMGSFLTDVILDHSRVPEQNYYVLLDGGNLKNLSLRCCGVVDETCEKIAERMQRPRPGEKLVALNLAVNCITDRGAKALGHALRTNRRLSYLNLCGNSITSDGAAHILYPLTKFLLNPDEVIEAKKSGWELAKQKIEADKIYLADITNLDKKFRKEKQKSCKQLINKGQETQSVGIGTDEDIFMSNLEVSSGVWFSLGNFTLCYLNLAFNQLDFIAVSKIADVLSYQNCKDMGLKSGLMRVVIEGNQLPNDSPKYRLIDKYMRIALNIPPDVTEKLQGKVQNNK